MATIRKEDLTEQAIELGVWEALKALTWKQCLVHHDVSNDEVEIN